MRILDTYRAERSLRQVDKTKIEIERAEALARTGVESLLYLPLGMAPAFFESAERLMRALGYGGSDALEHLSACGPTSFDHWATDNRIEVNFTSGKAPMSPNLFAVKQPVCAS